MSISFGKSSEKKVDGILFTEKTKTTVEGDLYGPELREKVHTRTIGEKVYTVVEVKPMNGDEVETSVETSMTDEEVTAFLTW